MLIVAVTSDPGISRPASTPTCFAMWRSSRRKSSGKVPRWRWLPVARRPSGTSPTEASSRCSPSRDIRPTPSSLRRPSCRRYVMQAYAEGKLDEVFIVYNHAKNAAEQTLVEQQVLPVKEESYADLLGLKAKERTFSSPSASGTIPPSSGRHRLRAEHGVGHVLHDERLPEQRVLLRDARFRSGRTRRSPQLMKSATDNANEMVSPWSAFTTRCARARHYHGDHRDRRRCRNFGGLNG